MPLLYDYSAARERAKAAGLGWHPEIEAQVDPEFAALGLTPAQADRLMQMHLHYLLWSFNTITAAPVKHRLKVALSIALGRGL